MEGSRVEKYRAYREEIQNSFSEADVTTSQKTSEKVSQMLNSQNGNTLPIDEIINVHEIYEKDDVKEANPLAARNKKIKIYYLVVWSLVIVLIGLMIFFAIMAFGGK